MVNSDVGLQQLKMELRGKRQKQQEVEKHQRNMGAEVNRLRTKGKK